MRIFVDNDACPIVIREIIVRTAERLEIETFFIANQYTRTKSSYIKSIVVPQGADVADDKIVEMVEEGDLVITADIPLADRIVSKGAQALNPRGYMYTEENIKQRLGMRNFMEDLRSADINTGGAAPFSNKDKQLFASQLDKFINKNR